MMTSGEWNWQELFLSPEQKLQRKLTEKRIGILIQYISLLYAGLDHLVSPPAGCTISQQEANKVVADIEQDFKSELDANPVHWRDIKGITEYPRFTKLAPRAKITLLYEWRNAKFEVYHKET